jgi:hypothetical protein
VNPPPLKGRFRRLYLRYQRRKPSFFRKLLSIVGGVALLAAGLVMLVAPGPGVLCLLLGAGMLAQNSASASRFLDRAWAAAARIWRRLS